MAPISAEVEAIIEHRWRVAQAEARARDAELFCGALCRLEGHEIHDGVLSLWFSRTDYRRMLGTSGDAPAAVAGARADGVGVSAIVSTRDSFVVVARRSQQVIDRPGMLDTGGGHVDPDTHLTLGTPDPFVAIRCEVEDELGVEPNEIGDIRLLGLARHRPGEKPELVFHVPVDLNFDILDSRRTSAPESYEMSGIQPIPATPASLAAFIAEHRSELTEAGHASLELERRYLADELTEGGRIRIADQ